MLVEEYLRCRLTDPHHDSRPAKPSADVTMSDIPIPAREALLRTFESMRLAHPLPYRRSLMHVMELDELWRCVFAEAVKACAADLNVPEMSIWRRYSSVSGSETPPAVPEMTLPN